MSGTLPTAHRVAAVALMVLHTAVHTAAFALPGSVALLGSQRRVGLVARGPLGAFSKPRVSPRRFAPLAQAEVDGLPDAIQAGLDVDGLPDAIQSGLETLALAPSGVNGLPLPMQAAVFFAIMGLASTVT
ncbi:hypothetical protein T484DRAFT_1850217 [Baffinella frigidus]|nr:hypothetical protein T484DRAFT_1850217 [Cryptophyta sp. CCMP2293]